MKTQKLHLSKNIVSLTLCTLLLGSFSACSNAQSTISSNMDIKPVRKLTPQEQESLSLASKQVLTHIQRARLALEQNNMKDAKNNLDKSSTLVNIIKKNLPEYTITTKINSGKLSYNNSENVKSMYVPIVNMFDSYNMFKDSRLKNKKEDAVVVQDQGVEQNELKLNVYVVQQDVQRAQLLLTKKDFKGALASLDDLNQNALVFIHNQIESPLVTAEENIRLGEWRLEQKNPAAAKVLFHQAIIDLANYKKVADQTKGTDIDQIQGRLSKLVDTLKDNQVAANVLKSKERLARDIRMDFKKLIN